MFENRFILFGSGSSGLGSHEEQTRNDTMAKMRKKGVIGELIRVKARDDVQVIRVEVLISDETGLLERE